MLYPSNSITGGIYDALIVGGGPAGASAAAFLASSGRSVLVLERSRLPREKLCGEFMTPECLSIFERLGALPSIRDAGAATIERMDLIAPSGRRLEIPARWFPGGLNGALGLTRARLDSILIESARQSGADVIEGITATSFERFSDGFVLTTRDHDSQTRRFCGRILIDASGRAQRFGQDIPRESGARQKRRWFAAKVHLRNVKGIESNGELYFFDEGYGGITAVEPDREGPRFNLCFLTSEEKFRQTKGDRALLLESTVMSNPVARERLSGAVVCGEWLGAGPIIYGKRLAAPGVIPIGDAGAFIDPFTGSGILLALSSAEMLASAVAAQSQVVIQPEAVHAKYIDLLKESMRWRLGVAAFLRKVALSSTGRRLTVPLLAHNSGLRRFLTRATRHGGNGVVLPTKE